MTDRWSPLEGVVAAGGAAAAGLAAHSVLNWRLLRKTPASPTPQDHRPSVSVLIPARDEADRLGPTLEAVLSQEGVDLEVLVLDDGSTDEDEPSPAPAGPAPWGTLVSLSSHPPLDLTGAAHTLGRGAACSLVLSQSFISTTHARLLRDGGDGAPAVEDTSTNGVWLNGQKVGDHVLDPPQTVYPKRVDYMAFDVLPMLTSGENVVGALLGNYKWGYTDVW